MRLLSSIAILLLLSANCFAQFTYGPVVNTNNFKSNKNAKIESDTLSLPFWDDFSFATDNVPSAKLWEGSESVYVGDGIGKNPPSIGVASLDGVKSDGLGYGGSSSGPTDALTSCPIDLSGLSVSDEVFLSFFYQYAGNGEIPEAEDSIAVEMLNSDDVWVTIWPNGGELDRSGDFTQEILRLDSTNFFHEAFRFRIQSFGRPVGFFDIWNIDYVYLNKDRSLSDNHYPDRTISTPLTNILDGFHSVPAKHYTNSLNKAPQYDVSSVDNPSDPQQPYGNAFIANSSSWKNGTETVASSGQINETVESIKAPNRTTEQLDSLFKYFQIPENQDSVFIDITTFISSNDNILPSPTPPSGDYDPKYDPIDFRVNDTIHNSYVLKDYYAYDDGTAELSAGFSFSGNQIAIKYPMIDNITDTLVAVDMYFPLSKTEPAGRSVDLIVWDYNDSIPGEILYRATITILRDPKPNTFTRYLFKNLIVVRDTFLIGYRQNNEGVLGLGFDVNNNTNQNVYFNLGGAWQQKQSTDLRGSFMIRPVFGDSIPSTTTGIEDIKHNSYNIYPNPTKDYITIEGTFERALVYDLYGRLILNKEGILEEQLTNLDLSNEPVGIYIIKLRKGNKSETYKVIKR